MADYYTLLTDAGIAYETACKAAGVPIKLAQISVGDGNGAVYNPDASAKALKREVWRGPLNALFQDEKNANWLMAEVTIPSEVGGWYVREAGLWTDTGILYAVVKYPESYKPVLATSGSGKEFYIRSIFETSNAAIVTLLIDDTVVKATRAWVMDYLGKGTYSKAEIEGLIAKASALPVGVMVPFPLGSVPPGYLEVDNSLFKDDVYPDLAAYLAKKFNLAGDAAGYTRLPESRGEFFRGWDHGRGIDAGRAIGTYQSGGGTVMGIEGRLSNSSGTIAPFNVTVPGDGNQTAWLNTGDASSASDVDLRFSLNGLSNRPRNLVVMWCIKAWNAPVNQGNIDISALATQLQELSVNGPAVGTTRNGKMFVGTQATPSTYTADELILMTALGGKSYKLSNFNKTINVATVGVGGMDTGAAPVNGFVGIYAIYNPTANASGLLAVNATGGKASEVYGGVHMPTGYTASCLLTVVPTTVTSQISPVTVRDREVRVGSFYVYTTNAIVTNILVSAGAMVPFNAVSMNGTLEATCTAASQLGLLLTEGDAPGLAGLSILTAGVVPTGTAACPFTGLSLNTSRQFAVSTSIAGSGTATYRVAISGYKI
ncbi:phage tail protein [Pseudomonas sp. S09G 359]|uniref:phage tail-collar fiber domain-containing protein n=1 Tax=Pseudomonas sp. S09G 359 TaxID=2054919 RepID=UPI0021157644|nr:phage tail protein [Pseudomonas sp. S09G 359]